MSFIPFYEGGDFPPIELKPYNPIAKMKGLGRGVFGEPIDYQRKLREEWEGR